MANTIVITKQQNNNVLVTNLGAKYSLEQTLRPSLSNGGSVVLIKNLNGGVVDLFDPDDVEKVIRKDLTEITISDVSTLFDELNEFFFFKLAAGGGGSDTPWTENHDAAGFNLSALGILSFSDVNTSIQKASADLQLDVATGGATVLRVNNVAEYDFDSSRADFLGNSLINSVIDGDLNTILDINETQMNVSVGASGFVLTSNGVGSAPTYQASAGGEVFTWTANHSMATFKLTATAANNVILDAPTGQNIELQVAGAQEYLFSATEANFSGNNLNLNGGLILFDDVNTTIQQVAGALLYDVASTFAHDLRVNNAVEYRFGATVAGWNGNDLDGMGILSFGDVNTSIQQASTDLQLDVATGGRIILRINNVAEYDFSLGTADFTGNSITNATIDGDLNTIIDINETQMNVSVGVSGFILTSNGVGSAPTYQVAGGGGEVFTWTADHSMATFKLVAAAGNNVILNAPTGQSVEFQVAGTQELILSSTFLDIDAKYIELESIASPGVTGSATIGRIFMDSGNSEHLSIIRNGSVIDLEAGSGGEVFTWTADHSMATFKLTATASNNVILNAPTGQNVEIEVAGSQEYLFGATVAVWNGNDLSGMGILSFGDVNTSFQQASTDLQIDVATGGAVVLRVNNSPEYDFDSTRVDFNSNNIINLGTLNTHGIPAGSAELVDLSTGQVLTNKTIDGDLNTIIDINETQMNVSAGGAGTVLTSNGVGSPPTYQAAGGGEVFTWTANHDANGFALEDTRFADDTDNTKIIDWNLTGMTTAIVLTFSTSQSTAQTLSIPNITQADVLVTEAFSQTLINKTLTTPTIGDLSNMTHTHANAAGGGQLTNSALTPGVFASITGLGAQSQTLDMNSNNVSGISILSFGDVNTSIQQATADLQLDVATGGAVVLRVNNSPEYDFDSTRVDFLSNNIINLGTLNTHTLPSGSDELVDLSTGQVLTNKTIDGDLNTFIDINETQMNVSVGAAGFVLTSTGVGNPPTYQEDLVTVNFVIDGGGSVITTGIKGHVTVDFACEVVEWAALADQSGSIVVDVNRSTFAGYPTTSSIAGTELPTISSSTKGEDRTITTWSTIAKGDVLEFEVDSITSIQRVTIAVVLRKT